MGIYREKDAQGAAATHGGRATFKPMREATNGPLQNTTLEEQALAAPVSASSRPLNFGAASPVAGPKLAFGALPNPARMSEESYALAVTARTGTPLEQNALAMHPQLAPETANYLAATTKSDITQLALLSNRELTAENVTLLAKSSSPAVRTAAKRHSAFQPTTLRERAVVRGPAYA